MLFRNLNLEKKVNFFTDKTKFCTNKIVFIHKIYAQFKNKPQLLDYSEV